MVDNFRSVATGVIAVSGFSLLSLLLFSLIFSDLKGRTFMKTLWEKGALIILSFFLIGGLMVKTFVPDREGVVIIVAGALGYEGALNMVNSEHVQSVGSKSFELLESWLNQQIEEINTEKDEPEIKGENNGNP